jgi:NAD(P)-dependent dehydrogenase (short-subunit alcohol dehydrogenase family)
MSFFGFGSTSFDPAKDIPSLTDKVILVTGGNCGLGRQSVLDLARQKPAHIWLAARDAVKAQEAIDGIRKELGSENTTAITHLPMDLCSLASVREAAEKVLAETPDRLDILMLNAGIMAHPPGLTKDGYEIQFGTNHMGHALLTKLLLPTVLKTPGSRVIVVASSLQALAPGQGIDYDTVKTPGEKISTWARYGQSKLANVLYASELARRHPELMAVSCHPGVVETNLMQTIHRTSFSYRILDPFMRLGFVTVSTGAKNQLWAATAEGVETGTYYTPVGVKGSGWGTGKGRDEALAKQLWEWTEKELEGK